MHKTMKFSMYNSDRPAKRITQKEEKNYNRINFGEIHEHKWTKILNYNLFIT